MFAELFASLMPLVALFATVTMLVLRAGASRIFFDVVGSFQATRLIGDAQAKITVLQGLVLDGLSGITEGVGLIGEQMNQLVDSTVPLAQEIGYARIEFEKFVQAGDDADAMASQIESIGLRFGFAGDQALAAGAKMAQLSSLVGGGAAVPAATEIGIAFGMVGGMETEEAMKRLINLQQQTMFMYGGLTQAQYERLGADERVNLVRQESIKMLNQLNTIENRSSATMAQVTHVMNQFASSAKLAGDETTYMAAASATLIEAGEEQGKAGRALKMIYARLGADTGNNSEVMRQFGIETKNADGSLRGLSEILEDINKIYPSLANNERLQIAQAMAGNDHYVRAIKLMDNYNRTMQLQGMAVEELDTAQDELNKRFEDNAFLLTQSEANLKNAKAALGEQFTPAVIRANEAQASLTQSFADMLQELRDMPGVGGAAGKAIDGLFGAMQVGRVFAPFVEANLNIMSLNVSLQTQLQIQRALSGQDIVRASAYGQQGSMLRANLGTLSQTAAIEDKRALTAASLLKMGTSRNTQRQAALNISSGQLTNDQAMLQSRIQQLQTEQAIINAKKTELDLEKLLTPQAYNQREAMLGIVHEQQAINEEKREGLMLMDLESAYLLESKNYKMFEGKTAEQMMQASQRYNIHKNAQLRMEQHNLDVMRQQALLHTEMIELGHAEVALTKGQSAQDERRLKVLKTELDLAHDLLTSEGQRQIMSQMNSEVILGQSKAAQILRQAHIDIIAATQQKSNTEQQNNMIMQAAEQAARELAMAYGLDEAALRRLIPQMEIFEDALRKVSLQSDMVVNDAMRMNNNLMILSGSLGALSMGFSMFGDNAKASRISMLLLNASMIPMTIQMIASTKASYGLMTGFSAAGKAADGAAAATTRYGVALKGLGVGLALGAAAYLAYRWMPDAKEDADNLSSSLDNLNNIVTYSQESYQRMAKEMEGKTLNNVIWERSMKEGEIFNLREEMANITEPALLKVKQNQLDLAEEELAVLQDIEALRQAEYLRENTADAKKLYDTIKGAMDAEKEHQRLMEKDTGFFANIAGDIENFIAQPIVESFGFDYQTFDEMVAAAGKDAEAALASIPDELGGAFVEAARGAETFEDFLAVLEQFQEPQYDDPLGDFGANLQANFIGPIEAAKEAAFEFSNAREEMFFGMSKGNITGDMVKQVVNKGVETLINTTEVIMTNNFTGMTTTQAANEITKQVVEQLNARGLNLSL